MTHPTKSKAKKKPAKPSEDFPLFAHGNGQWAAKIRGQLHYFGTWDDPEAALKKYLAERDDLKAGRTPHVDTGGLTVRDLVNGFLTSKKIKVDSGEITPRTFADYHATCERTHQGLRPDAPARRPAS